MTPMEGVHKNAMMIDIETLSLNPTAYVTQIGFCVADLETGEYLVQPRSIWPEDSQNGEIDINTVSWWMQQDKSVARNVFVKPAEKTPVASARTFLTALVEKYDCTVWASPAMFDLPILTNLFGGRKPWKYYNERCLMTLYKLVDPQGKLRLPANGAEHDAAADAKWQMDYLLALWRAGLWAKGGVTA